LETPEFSVPETAGIPDYQNPVPKETGAKRKKEAHHHGLNYLPAITSFVLLLTGMGLDFFEAAWFTAIPELLLYGVAYILVGGKVLAQAARNITKGDLFNEFFLMGIATL